MEWYADSAFNAGLAAAKAEDHMSAAVLFGAAGSFYGGFRTASARSVGNRMVYPLLLPSRNTCTTGSF